MPESVMSQDQGEASSKLTPEDERFLDSVLDRAVDMLHAGAAPEAAELAAERPHLLDAVQAQLEVARTIVPRASAGMPSIEGYTLMSEVGRGGMGTVYLARQERLGGRPVALKVLSESSSLSLAARRRFRQESEAIARLRHPHIVGVHDVVERADPRMPPAFAMEWVEGRSLAAVIEHVKTAGGGPASANPAPIDEVREFVAGASAADGAWPPTYILLVCRIGIAIARALAAVHKAGLLHRDVKPSNILIRSDGVPLLTDFGLARDVESDATLVTQAGQFVGTPAYAAPEQLRGEGEALDARSDVYSLGVTLYHALAMRLPFEGQGTTAVLRNIEAGRCAALRGIDRKVPRDLETIVAKAMEMEPGRRYQGAEEVAEDLERLVSLRPIRARRASVVGRMWKFTRRNKGLVAVMVIALVTATSGIAVGVTQRLEQGRQAAALRSQEARAAAATIVADFSAEILEELNIRLSAGINIQNAVGAASGAVRTVGKMVADKNFGDGPLPEAELHQALGSLCYIQLGLNGLAERHYRKALDITEKAGGDALALKLQVARCLDGMGRSADAEELIITIIDDLRDTGQAHSSAMVRAMEGLGLVRLTQRRFLEAAEVLEEAVSLRRRLDTAVDWPLIEALNKLGNSLRGARELDRAEKVLREALRESESLEASTPGASVMSRRYLARVALSRHQTDEGELMQRDVLERSIAVWGRNHRETITAWCELAKTRIAVTDFTEAELLLREALKACRASSRPFPHNDAIVFGLLAQALEAIDREEEAREARRSAEEARKRAQGVGGG